MIDVKAYLKQIRYKRNRIEQLKAIRSEIGINIDGIKGIDYSGVKVQTSARNATEEAAWRLLEHLNDIDIMIMAEADGIYEILHNISKIENELYTEILLRRYSDYKTFDQIADDLGYETTYITNNHGYALQALRNIINRENIVRNVE